MQLVCLGSTRSWKLITTSTFKSEKQRKEVTYTYVNSQEDAVCDEAMGSLQQTHTCMLYYSIPCYVLRWWFLKVKSNLADAVTPTSTFYDGSEVGRDSETKSADILRTRVSCNLQCTSTRGSILISSSSTFDLFYLVQVLFYSFSGFGQRDGSLSVKVKNGANFLCTSAIYFLQPLTWAEKQERVTWNYLRLAENTYTRDQSKNILIASESERFQVLNIHFQEHAILKK